MKTPRLVAFAAAFCCYAAFLSDASTHAAPRGPKPNVLLIPVDDLNDWVGFLGGHPQTETPNLDRLAARGVAFSNAHCAAPACNPSRVALLTGLRPSSTGVYHNPNPWRPVLPKVITLPKQFMDNGYFCAGFGKVYHGEYADPSDWDIWKKAQQDNRSAKPEKHLTDGGVKGIAFGPLANSDEEMIDYINVDRAVEQMNIEHGKPWFIACGFIKPHMAFSVPKKYFDKFPLKDVKLPYAPESDLDDVPPAGVAMAKPKGDHAAILASGRWKEAVQAYLATINFMDAQLGRLLEGLDASGQTENTVICLWSDHGWHLGEKQHWRKFALWERATKAPMIWVVPGIAQPGGACDRPVDHLNVYPTLLDLCDLPAPENPHGQKLEGASMRPLLENPTAAWDRPALTTHGLNNHALRDQRYRYIRYENGDEELYDHKNDPDEQKNIAGNPETTAIKKNLAKWFPSINAAQVSVDKNKKKGKKATKRNKSS